MKWHRLIPALACCAVLASTSGAQEPPRTTTPVDERAVNERTGDTPRDVNAARDSEGKILAAQTFRSSKLAGLNVRNKQGEVLGTIDDFVVDLATGKVEYAAMSVGGVLGIGDKLLAVPMREMKFNHGEDEMFFVLDMAKEKIAAAPGFNKQDWPNFADPNWTDQVNQHFRKAETRTGETRTEVAPRGVER